ncbi:MAG TPA: carboxylesterase family protein, partial [Acetobacteraceae bacterium]|nr:carboxylesterase family protein [Acetobacteraceae bacterium]
DNRVAVFRGVPYSAAPVGTLRFAAPETPSSWSGLRDASRHGPIAPQLPSRLAAAMGDFDRPQDEDCLTLTICTPAPDGKTRPVLVWLHGGAWISGAGSLDWYDGARLAGEGDIVFVGVNYRLGALGWLHRPGIVDAEPGTLDLIAALTWVRENIASFGGDPGCITLMGQSAGATSIGRLSMLPDARSLFHRAIMQSSGFGRGAYTSAMAMQRADQVLHLLDIDPQSSAALPRLRAVEVPRLLAAQAELARANARFAQTMPMFMPVLPSAMTHPAMLAAIAEGLDGKPVLIGATADEVHAFFAADPRMQDPPEAAVVARFGGAGQLARYRARRPGGSAMDLLADLATDETFLLPAMRLAEAIARRGGSAYAYLFDWAPPTSRFRSCHCIELPFVFGTFSAWSDAEMLAGGDVSQTQALSAAMRRSWIAFVRGGDPSHEAMPPWPRYDDKRRWTMRVGARTGIVGDPAGLTERSH